MVDVFAQMENICINNHPIIAQQTCDQNFTSIQEAIQYLENSINQDSDTIYTASHYWLTKSILKEYCGDKIDKNEIEKKLTMENTPETIEIMDDIQKKYNTRKSELKTNNTQDEHQYCTQKYIAYTMVENYQNEFLQIARNMWLLSPQIVATGDNDVSSDKILLYKFSNRNTTNKETQIKYFLSEFHQEYPDKLANIIKNITIQSSETAMKNLEIDHILTKQEKETIQEALNISFSPSCGTNKWYHKIQQYYNDDNTVEDTILEEIKLNIWLCKSYQYMDQLSEQIQKLLIHEIGHYVYFFKDKENKTFSDICRKKQENNNITNTCENNDFISNYAKTSSEEDYAETFSRWAIARHKETLFSWSLHNAPAVETTLAKKLSYFDTKIIIPTTNTTNYIVTNYTK